MMLSPFCSKICRSVREVKGFIRYVYNL